MKILVTIKRVADHNIVIRVLPSGQGVDLANVKTAVNPFDLVSLEAALRLKEAGWATEVVVLSIGPAKAEETLRHALALGADRAILIETDQLVEPLAVAKIITAIAAEEQPDLVLIGKQAIDDDCGQAGQMVSALCGWPQAAAACALEPSEGSIEVTCEVDSGRQTLALALPAVITTSLRLNTPRLPKLPNIMRAKGKPLAKRPIADLGIDTHPRLKVIDVGPPPRRKAGMRVDNVAQLVSKLKSEAGVL